MNQDLHLSCKADEDDDDMRCRIFVSGSAKYEATVGANELKQIMEEHSRKGHVCLLPKEIVDAQPCSEKCEKDMKNTLKGTALHTL